MSCDKAGIHECSINPSMCQSISQPIATETIAKSVKSPIATWTKHAKNAKKNISKSVNFRGTKRKRFGIYMKHNGWSR